MSSLRDRLRHETAPLHQAAARAMAGTGCLDAADPGAFLAIQARVFADGPAPAAAGADPEAGLALRLHAAVARALRSDLGGAHPAFGLWRGAACRTPPVLPTAYAYVVLGATAGIGRIAPRWSPGGHFLDLVQGLRPDWAALTARLALMSASGDRADRTVAAARALFGTVIPACRVDPAAADPARPGCPSRATADAPSHG